MKYTLPRIKLAPAPVHVVQYEGSPHAYGCIFTTRATTTRGITRAAARAAREDASYFAGRPVTPTVTRIDDRYLIPRDWQDPEMMHMCAMIEREASKHRPPKMHDSAVRESYYSR